MTVLHIQSVSPPYDEPSLASAAVTALSHGDAMGLLTEPITCLNDAALRILESSMRRAGVGNALVSEPHSFKELDPDHLLLRLEKISQALHESPVPACEWQSLHGILGLDLLGCLLGISESSARRYLSGSRATPDKVADCLHFLALIVGDLGGAYSDVGVRRWFDRKRSQLGGRTPAQILGKDWSPDDDGARRVEELARALRYSPVT